jgi:hypothetical protein
MIENQNFIIDFLFLLLRALRYAENGIKGAFYHA